MPIFFSILSLGWQHKTRMNEPAQSRANCKHNPFAPQHHHSVHSVGNEPTGNRKHEEPYDCARDTKQQHAQSLSSFRVHALAASYSCLECMLRASVLALNNTKLRDIWALQGMHVHIVSALQYHTRTHADEAICPRMHLHLAHTQAADPLFSPESRRNLIESPKP